MRLRKGSKEEWVFNLLLNKSDLDTNIVKFNPLDSDNKDKFYRGVALLKNDGLIAQLGVGVYMLNPHEVKPLAIDKTKVLQHWLEVSNKNH